jgi:catechol 2,3-dioxygenase-like lactoylglutathione lyase family enzyme
MSKEQYNRRRLLTGIGALATAALVRPWRALSRTAWAQASPTPALPLKNLGLEHLDIVVPDTEVSAKVYMRVFKTRLHQQPFQGAIRYFILLGDLPQDRQVGYIAIGASGGTRPTAIGHYCALAERYDRAGVAQALQAAGFSAGTGGAIGMLPDPDGLELQLFQPPAGLVAAAVPSALPIEGDGLVTPRGVDHVLLNVTDIEKSLPYYHLVYGNDIKTTRTTNPDRLWIQLEKNTRIGLQKAPAGQKPRFDHYCIKVAPFDRDAVTAGLRQIGLSVLPSPDEPDVLRFSDNYGITVELKPA